MSSYSTLDRAYHLDRKTRKSYRYRVNRRTNEVIRCIKKYYSGDLQHIIDLGTADAVMLSQVKNSFSPATCIGVEYSKDLLSTITDLRLLLIQGDVNYVPVADNSIDIAIATAVIEHLPDPKSILNETVRILKPEGILILSTPDPFWEHVATFVGHLKDDLHYEVLNLKKIVSLLQESGFEVLEQRKFMLSPVGIPLEIPIETIVRRLGLNFLFANQIVVGKKLKI
jgi:ubiquinone/menaquinone biosynthesis C-methylase UbiE